MEAETVDPLEDGHEEIAFLFDLTMNQDGSDEDMADDRDSDDLAA